MNPELFQKLFQKNFLGVAQLIHLLYAKKKKLLLLSTKRDPNIAKQIRGYKGGKADLIFKRKWQKCKHNLAFLFEKIIVGSVKKNLFCGHLK